MSLLLALALAQGATATATVTIPVQVPLPRPVEAAISAYDNCLFDAIDAQDRRGAYSERAVLSACASVRRAKYDAAMARLNAAGRRRVNQRFAELDELVWAVVDHVRERHGHGRRN